MQLFGRQQLIKMLRPADLILVKGTGFIDSEIEKISRSPYSHVAGVVDDKLLIEAQGFTKTRYQSLNFYKNYDVFTCDELTDEQRIGIVNFAKNQIGTHYNYALIGWELIRYETDLFLPMPKIHEYICSTLWSDAYKSEGIELVSDVKYPSPGDLPLSTKLRKEGVS